MARTPISASFIKRQIDSVRGFIGRDVDIYTPIRTNCPRCTASGYYDSLNDTTFDTICPICLGDFYVNSETRTTVLARVHWTGDEIVTATPGGKYFIGDGWIIVDPSYLSLMQQAQTEGGRVVVDGQEMQITKLNPWGVPEVNRLRVVLKSTGDRRDT